MCNKNFCKKMQDDKLHEECGVFGIATLGDETIDVREEVRYALYALQHRGQESCGISVNEDGVMHTLKAPGLVPDVLTNEALERLPKGDMAIGHVRYGKKLAPAPLNAQPLFIRHAKGTLSMCFNGQLTNAPEIREEYQNKGIIFHTDTDAEVIAYTIANERLTSDSIEEAVEIAMNKLQGAISLVVMSPRKLIAARDNCGFRPLCIGKLPSGGYVFASETCALDVVGAEFVRDIKPGEIVEVADRELKVYKEGVGNPTGLCIFEFVYFARPDSVIEGQSVHMARKIAGEHSVLQ